LKDGIASRKAEKAQNNEIEDKKRTGRIADSERALSRAARAGKGLFLDSEEPRQEKNTVR
jgi:hypothetical protein